MTSAEDTPDRGIPTQTNPPRFGDKVVYIGPLPHPAWQQRRTEVGIVVAAAASAEYYTWVYSPAEQHTWQAPPGALRVVERAEYTPTAEHTLGGAP